MYQYAIVFYPKGDLEKIQSIREKYDPQFHVIPPHITLVSPFSDIPEEKIIEHISQVTKNIHSFSIHLHGLMKSFDEYLFLLVQEGKEDVFSLHDKLYSGILAPHLSTDIPFIPHITLGDFSKDSNQYPQALTEAEEMQINLSFLFDNITLIKGDGVTAATTIQIFPLKG